MSHKMTIWTVGHSNHEWNQFVQLLTESGIRLLADVRRFPGSRRLPQFQQSAMITALAEAQIDYRHFEDLGGRRSSHRADSPNQAWRVAAFNAYADHMQTAEFQESLAILEQCARELPTAMMCSEAVPWRCHRRLIADALVVRGWTVLDIFSPGKTKPHTLTEFARVVDGTVIYPGLFSGTDEASE